MTSAEEAYRMRVEWQEFIAGLICMMTTAADDMRRIGKRRRWRNITRAVWGVLDSILSLPDRVLDTQPIDFSDVLQDQCFDRFDEMGVKVLCLDNHDARWVYLPVCDSWDPDFEAHMSQVSAEVIAYGASSTVPLRMCKMYTLLKALVDSLLNTIQRDELGGRYLTHVGFRSCRLDAVIYRVPERTIMNRLRYRLGKLASMSGKWYVDIEAYIKLAAFSI